MPHIVVIGAGYAGVLAALRAARTGRGRVDVSLISATDRFVERVRLHEQAAGGRAVDRPLAELLTGTAVRLVHATVSRIERGVVHTSAGPIAFDRAIVCTGSRVDVDVVPGARAHTLPIDGDRVAELFARARALAGTGGRVAVCGGGLTGVELAAELAEANPGLAVELIAAGELMPMLGARARAHALKVLGRLGVTVREHTRIREVAAGRLDTTAGEIGFDLCAWAAGFRASPLLAASGLPTTADGRAAVDAALRARPDLYVAGDAARVELVPGRPLPAGCKTAMPMAAQAADNAVAELTGAAPQAFRFGDAGFCVSLGRRDGIIQLVDIDGRPSGATLTGRFAAWLKEQICRYTVFALHAERRGLMAYRWRKPRRVALPAAEVAA
jgi:NADH dehydrogenase FAD-containing subunit